MSTFKLVLLAGLAGATLAAAPQDAEQENLGLTLVAKRTKVDGLSAELELRRGEVKERSRVLALQRADLERQLTAGRLELEEAERSLAKAKEEVSGKEAARASLKPLTLEQIAKVQDHVRKSLPFKTAERIAELDRLGDQVRKDEMKPDLALAKLWSSLEDELRLARESGLYRQSVEIDGAPVLADVARLGMVLLYYRTFDDRVGMAVPGAEGRWTYVPVQDLEGRRRVQALFDALKKNIRQGYFEVPNPYAGRNGR
jgi:hypothetical protein